MTANNKSVNLTLSSNTNDLSEKSVWHCEKCKENFNVPFVKGWKIPCCFSCRQTAMYFFIEKEIEDNH